MSKPKLPMDAAPALNSGMRQIVETAFQVQGRKDPDVSIMNATRKVARHPGLSPRSQQALREIGAGLAATVNPKASMVALAAQLGPKTAEMQAKRDPAMSARARPGVKGPGLNLQ